MRTGSVLGVRPFPIGRTLVPAGIVLVCLALSLPGAAAVGIDVGVSTSSGPSPTFTLGASASAIHLAPSFWGADARIYYPANSTLATAYTASGLSYVRWPGGAVADQYNISANRIVQDGGHFDTPPTSLLQFVQWCDLVHCHAIIQLPAEIGSPATAAYQVAYIERTIGFHPAYFELGNEPALWKHYDIPWAQWNSTQHSSADAAQYAAVVHADIAAIRTVDPTARILGLPGVGSGAFNEVQWIQATVAENGPNLSGVAIHVYPAGSGTGASVSVAKFYSSLTGPGSLAVRVPLDRAAIRSACPTCANPIPLFVTELGSANAGGGLDPIMKSFANVPYIATELLQGMQLNVTNLDLFALEGTYPGSLLGPNSAVTRVGMLYETFATQLGNEVLSATAGPVTPGFHFVVTSGRSPGTFVLLAVNANLTTTQTLVLGGSGFPTGPGEMVSWAPAMPRPTVVSDPGGVPTTLTVTPGEVVMVVAHATSGATGN